MGQCGQCQNYTAVTKLVPVDRYSVSVTRCTMCDARRCADCGAYTSDPAGKVCARCRAPFFTSVIPPVETDGDPGSITCRHCGSNRTLEGQNKAVGRRVLVCWTCDVPVPEGEPLVVLGAD